MLQVWASLGAGLDPKMLCAASLVCLVGLFLTMTLLGRAFANTNFQAAFVALSAISGGAVIWAAHFVAMTAYHPQLQSGYDPVRTTFAFMTALAGMTASFWAATASRRAWSPALAGGLFGIGVTAAMAAGLNAFQTQGVLMWSSLSLLKSTPVSVLLATAAFLVGRDMRGWKRPMIAAPLLFAAVAMTHLAATTGITVSGDPSIALPTHLIAPEVLAAMATLVAVFTVAAGHFAADRADNARAFARESHAVPETPSQAAPIDRSEPAPSAAPPARANGVLLASAGSEILAPLQGMAAQAGALARTDLQPAQRDLVQSIGASAAALERLMAELIDLAGIEAAQIPLRRDAIDLSGAVERIGGLASRRASARGIGFRLQMDAPAGVSILGDQDRIEQVALNLLDHALLSIDGGEVILRIASATTGDALRLEARAAGFSMQEKPRGLSLALANQLALLMGGRVDAPVVDGAGASFAVELPAVSPPTVAMEAPTESAPQGRPRMTRVLLAEADPDHRKAIELLLQGPGVDIMLVADGAQAIEAFNAARFDVILLDTDLPVLDGLAATRTIRELESLRGLPHTPIIALSLPTSNHQAEASLRYGADAHIAKPVTAAVLQPAIERLMHEASNPAPMDLERAAGAA